MIIECPRCKTRYSVKDSDVPNGGAPVECIECGNIFTVFIEPLPIILTRLSREEAESEFQKYSKRKAQLDQVMPDRSDFSLKSPTEPKKKEAILEEKEMFRSEFEMPLQQKKSDFPGFSDDFGLGKQTAKKDPVQDVKPSKTFDFQEFSAKPKETFDDSFAIQSGGALSGPKREDRIGDDIRMKKDKNFAQTSSSLEEFFNIPKTPEDKLRNLANRVVNELKMYYPEESDESAKSGKVPVNLLNEIKKALQFYRQEAVKEAEWELAVVYFRDAINTIIGRGKILFR